MTNSFFSLIFLYVLFGVDARVYASAVEPCEPNLIAPDHLRLQLTVTDERVRRNKFTVNRNLSKYTFEFRPGLSSFLNGMPPGARWLNSGAGMALAEQEALSLFPINIVSVSLIPPSAFTGYSNGPNFSYLSGRYLEDIPAEELGKFTLITDLFGPGSYSSRFSEVLQKYFDVLDENGVIFIVVMNSYVQTKDLELVELGEWLKRVPCVEIHKLVGGRGLMLRRRPQCSKVTIPKLNIIEFADAGPPSRVFEQQVPD